MRPFVFSHLFRDQHGIVLVMTLMLMGLMSALAATYTTMIRADTMLRGAAGRERKAFYAAEDGLNVAMARSRTRFDNFNPIALNETVTASVTTGSGAQQRTATYELKPSADCYPCAPQAIGAGLPFAGLNSVPYRYTLTSTEKNTANEEEVKLGTEITVHNVPIFQFLAVYRNNLFIMPLYNMPLNGRIHTNGNLRLNSDAILSVADSAQVPLVQVSAGGNIFRGANKYGAWRCTNNSVRIDRRSDNTPINLESCGPTAVTATMVSSFQGSVIARAPTLQIPNPQSMARGAGNRYWDAADLRIVLNLTAGRNTTLPCGPAPTGNLFPIEVQDQDGSRNVMKTTALWNFMCARRGAIFYTDVPTAANSNGAGASISGNSTSATGSAANNYNPSFANVNTIYRRVGEDVNGDGTINAADVNNDICPTSAAVGAVAPWWNPANCGATDGFAISTSWYWDSDYRRGGFYNRREDRWMYLLNVNVRALLEWNANTTAGGGNYALMSAAELGNDNGGGSQDGGVILYLSVQGQDSTAILNNYGVRVFDSADLDTWNTTFSFPAPADPTGITIVSDQAAYIEGNFNSRDQYPAAIMADALNILSQGWESYGTAGRNDRKSVDTALASRTVPVAPLGIPYTVNAAFIAGVGASPDGPAAYDGGLENYPRFHESWGNSVNLNIRGSFVSLGTSLHAVNNWAFGSGTTEGVYDPPGRPWNYDSAFDNVANLPPMTPIVTFIQQRMYTRFYE